MDPQIRHGAHGRLFLVKKPCIPARVNAPALRSSMAEGCPECNDPSDIPAFNQLLCKHNGEIRQLVIRITPALYLRW